jgi:enoyl-CoA hydratase
VTDTILAEQRGQAGIITLNRGRALNALDEAMLVAMTLHLRAWEDDPGIGCVVLRSAEPRAFCAGGDIKAVRDRRGDAAFMDRIYRIEYELDALIHHYAKPVVALINGITMGGGCGIALHAAYRIATPDLVLAMPETGIGFFPDVGGSVFLGRLPVGVGTYLGMTGARIAVGDALALGLVDAVVLVDQQASLLDRLAAGESPGQLVASLGDDAELVRSLGDIERIGQFFSSDSALAILRALEAASDPWARETARQLRRRCPFSLEITSRLVRRGAQWTLREALATDFRIAQRFMRRNDYFEGVRAVLIDRDQPAWQPRRLEDVDIAEVEACFLPLAQAELWLSD